MRLICELDTQNKSCGQVRTNNSYNIRGNISPHSLDADDEMEDCPAQEGQASINAAFVDHCFVVDLSAHSGHSNSSMK